MAAIFKIPLAGDPVAVGQPGFTVLYQGGRGFPDGDRDTRHRAAVYAWQQGIGQRESRAAE
ncbi:MAG TPA: hypothetical protein VIO61_05910 [Anaerolineaceae bacterium]